MTRTPWEQHQVEWISRYYKGLVGWKCTGVAVKVEDEFGFEAWPVLYFSKGREPQRRIEVSRDEEGNGPGHLFGLPDVTIPFPEPEKSDA
jgi:hypothetical protein